MRTSTLKALVWLWDSSGQRNVTHAELMAFTPHLTDSGYRSLLHVLKEQGYVDIESVVGNTTVRLTDRGRRLVSSRFPALSASMQSWRGDWISIVFLEAPSGDAQFRYLRSTLVNDHQALQVSRGVYFMPTPQFEQVRSLCEQQYSSNVLVSAVGDWMIGDERQIIRSHFQLEELIKSYSGISSNISSLLSSSAKQKNSTDQYKKQFFTVYDGLFDLLSNDNGIIHFYFPQVAKATDLVAKMQSIFVL